MSTPPPGPLPKPAPTPKPSPTPSPPKPTESSHGGAGQVGTVENGGPDLPKT